MSKASGRSCAALALGLGLLAATSTKAQTPSTTITTEYLMTVYFALDPPLTVDDQLRVANVRSEGSWASGPRIKAKVVPPSGDWPHRTADGQLVHLDVRVNLRTEDGDLIFMSYAGVVQWPADLNDRVARGEALKAGDTYWVTAPIFVSKAPKYSWLNGIQAVAKMISYKRGDHVTYDVFAIK